MQKIIFLLNLFFIAIPVFSMEVPSFYVGTIKAYRTIEETNNQDNKMYNTEIINITFKSIEFRTKIEFAFNVNMIEYHILMNIIDKEKLYIFLKNYEQYYKDRVTNIDENLSKVFFLTILWRMEDEEKLDDQINKNTNEQISFTIYSENRIGIYIPKMEIQDKKIISSSFLLYIDKVLVKELVNIISTDNINNHFNLLQSTN